MEDRSKMPVMGPYATAALYLYCDRCGGKYPPGRTATYMERLYLLADAELDGWVLSPDKMYCARCAKGLSGHAIHDQYAEVPGDNQVIGHQGSDGDCGEEMGNTS